MSQIVTVHSYRGGTGKSSTAANLAVLLARADRRVGLVDLDIQTPALDAVFDLAPAGPRYTLADYLVGRCEIEEAAGAVHADAGHAGLFLVPARSRVAGGGEVMGHGYDVGLLREGFDRLIDSLALDVLLLDTRAGFTNETVTAMASADVLLVLARADRLDLAGAAETRAVAERLGCPEPVVVVNHASGGRLPPGFREQLGAGLGAPVAAVLPYAPEMALLAGERLFSNAYPHHPLVSGYRRLLTTVRTPRP
ncbi:MinD/ParA family protein [Kitasatospora sp. NPDC088391]|uniref:MinD/ParA family ATP-binding protein n=1 Tax=Kitasatospora sp. NPDC088391 TaxID=3364074 RepID=UPI0038153F93